MKLDVVKSKQQAAFYFRPTHLWWPHYWQTKILKHCWRIMSAL